MKLGKYEVPGWGSVWNLFKFSMDTYLSSDLLWTKKKHHSRLKFFVPIAINALPATGMLPLLKYMYIIITLYIKGECEKC